MIDRRAFLRRLGFGTVSAAAAVCTFDIEKLLWVPGEKTILFPPTEILQPRGHQFVTADWMTRETMRVWKNNISLVNAFDANYGA